MRLSQQIAPHLPALRRFARAMSGTQESGDHYVAAMLEALIADPDLIAENDDMRVSLYRILVRIWGSVGAPSGMEEPPTFVQRGLDEMMPRTRQVFLLKTVEMFDTDQIARILEIAPWEVGPLLDAAGRDIAAQVASRILIIEDEPMIAMDLKGLVEGLGHDVTTIARTRAQAEKAALNDPPGLILADIQLADGSSGIDAVQDILRAFDVPVIFITAYPERLLTGEKPEPAFLIAKPYDADTVKAVVSQALFFQIGAGGGDGRRPAALEASPPA